MQRSEATSMTKQWMKAGGNQVQGRKKTQTYWQIQIIFTQGS